MLLMRDELRWSSKDTGFKTSYAIECKLMGRGSLWLITWLTDRHHWQEESLS